MDQAATWIQDFDGSVSTTGANDLLKEDKIKLRRNHFCKWAFLGRCKLKVQIRPFIQSDLQQTDTVTLKVFAIKKSDVKVSNLFPAQHFECYQQKQRYIGLTLKCLSYCSLTFVHKGVHLDPFIFRYFAVGISVRNLDYICIHLNQP